VEDVAVEEAAEVAIAIEKVALHTARTSHVLVAEAIKAAAAVTTLHLIVMAVAEVVAMKVAAVVATATVEVAEAVAIGAMVDLQEVVAALVGAPTQAVAELQTNTREAIVTLRRLREIGMAALLAATDTAALRRAVETVMAAHEAVIAMDKMRTHQALQERLRQATTVTVALAGPENVNQPVVAAIMALVVIKAVIVAALGVAEVPLAISPHFL